MATLDDVTRLASRLPEVIPGEHNGRLAWSVRRTCFAWVRPFRKADLKRFGKTTPPDGEILAVRVADLHEKEAVLAAAPAGIFTIPHFANYPAILIQIRSVSEAALHEALVDGWLACAPAALAERYLHEERRGGPDDPDG